MTASQILTLQSTFSLVAFALIARWHIAPRLSGTSVEDYLLPLAWVHVFRYAPLTLLVPGQVSSEVPANVANLIAYGDLASALLALVTVIFLKYRLAGALAVAWLFNIIGVADIVAADGAAVGAKIGDIPVGFKWGNVNFYLPALVVAHAMMVDGLVR